MKIRIGLAGTWLEAAAGMFGFAPPPDPLPAPTPCPHCHAAEALSLYATARTAYYRCVQCRNWWAVTPDDPHDTPHAEAA